MKITKIKINNLCTFSCYMVLIFLTSTYCFAEVFTGPVSSSTGGAGRSGAETAETIFLNPATIVQAKDFTMGTFFRDGYWSQNLHERTYAGTLIDNHDDTLIPGGLSYSNRKRHFKNIGTVDEMYGQITVGKFVTKYLSLGTALTYLRQDYAGGLTQWNGQIGAMYAPHPQFGFGLVVQNFISPSSDVPLFLRESLNVGGGMTYLMDKYFKFKIDVVSYKKDGVGWRGKYMLGAESDLTDYIAVRFGFNHSDVTGYKYYTSGLGIKTPRFGIDYSFELKDGARRGAMHSVDIRAPL